MKSDPKAVIFINGGFLSTLATATLALQVGFAYATAQERNTIINNEQY